MPHGRPHTRLSMHMRVSATLRKWSAALALVALVASVIGITAAMILGGMSSPPPPHRAVPRTTPAAPQPQVPTPIEFTINVVVTDQTCAAGAGCAYKYTIEPKYIGLHPLPETPFTVFYEVTGGHQPQKGEFTVHKNQAKILKDVVLDGPPGARLQATVVQVTG
jgi:hypothetical protein